VGRKIDSCEHVEMVQEVQFTLRLNSTLGLNVYLLPSFFRRVLKIAKSDY